MPRQQEQDKQFRCNNMALVSFLRMNGHSPQRVYWEADGETVYWEFFVLPALRTLMENFHRGEALVEPQEYNRQFQQTKREMYAQADHHRR